MMTQGGWEMIVNGFADGAGDQLVSTFFSNSVFWVETNVGDAWVSLLFSGISAS